MKILDRLLIMIVLIVIISFPVTTVAQENNNIRYSEKLQKVQTLIEQSAKQQHIKIDKIKWSQTKDNRAIATIKYGRLQKQVTFTKTELENISKNHIPAKTLKKIHKTINLLPGRDWPPGVKQ